MIDDVFNNLDMAMDKVNDAVKNSDFSNLGNQISGIIRNGGSSKREPQYFKDVSDGISGVVMGVGIVGIAVFGLVGGSMLGSTLWFFRTIAKISLVTAFFFIILLVFGIKGLIKSGHYRKYKDYLLKHNMYADIKVMAKEAGCSKEKAVSELKAFVRDKNILQGHFDEEEATFMATDALYAQYRRLNARKKEVKAAQAKEEARYNGLPEDVAAMIKKGKTYVKSIRENNDAIPDEIISAKLDRMESIVDKIFEQLKAKPHLSKRLNTLMDYYLPTTEKLLKAYREMSSETIQGENIRNTKNEIENSLDTINDAYEMLLNSMYEDEAVDLSTDISVMKTVMKQQGLTGSDLKAESAPQGEWENTPTLEELNKQIAEAQQKEPEIKLKL